MGLVSTILLCQRNRIEWMQKELVIKKILSAALLFLSSFSIVAFAEDAVPAAPLGAKVSVPDVSAGSIVEPSLKDEGINRPPIDQVTGSAGMPTDQVPTIVNSVTRSARPKLVIVPGGVKPLSFTESQQAMLNSAPPAKPSSPEANEAFNGMLQQNMPLSPQQVVRLRQMIDVSQRAAAVTPNVPPKPVSSTLMINLAPGATPAAIRLAQGYVSSLVFVDSTGSPWPIASYDVGDPKANTIQWDGKSNILLIQAISPYSDGNLVIRLIGLPTPVTLELVSGQRVVDYRADIHVPGMGPNAKDLPTGSRLPDSASQLLLEVLEGVAPPGSKQLSVKGGDCQAWLLGDKMYLRTRFTVLSPGWVGKMVSPDGMNAYEIQTTSSILVSQYGEPVELKVGGF
jgi:intracellular multiplication protein IcmK